MAGASVLLFCPKPCCRLSFSGFLFLTIPNLNYCRSLICHYNRNTHNVAFCIFSCRTFNNFYKPEANLGLLLYPRWIVW